MSSSGKWREQYEDDSGAERRALDARPVSALLEDVAAGRTGEHFRIWYSIAERADKREALPVLLAALERSGDYLQQYHCAVAMLHLLGLEPLVNGVAPTETSAVEYTTARRTHAEARQRIAAIIETLR